MVNLSKLTHQIRLHLFTSGTSISKPLGVEPEMPAASVVLSPANQILFFTNTRTWGLDGEVLTLHQLQVNVLLQSYLARKGGSLPSMVSRVTSFYLYPALSLSICAVSDGAELCTGGQCVWKVKE